MAMLADFVFAVGGTVCADASAAIFIGRSTRNPSGCSSYEGKLVIVKVGTDANPADLMTKHLKAEVVERHLETLAYKTAIGRAASAPRMMDSM